MGKSIFNNLRLTRYIFSVILDRIISLFQMPLKFSSKKYTCATTTNSLKVMACYTLHSPFHPSICQKHRTNHVTCICHRNRKEIQIINALLSWEIMYLLVSICLSVIIPGRIFQTMVSVVAAIQQQGCDNQAPPEGRHFQFCTSSSSRSRSCSRSSSHYQ